ncbi:hypothetical protein [Streptomyces sp. NPDC005262]|uniref:hypothetical protein n=1 Tax=Streptomyces sp. NPDC005262 TaxID=3364710 RepID=UPI00369CB1EF
MPTRHVHVLRVPTPASDTAALLSPALSPWPVNEAPRRPRGLLTDGLNNPHLDLSDRATAPAQHGVTSTNMRTRPCR